MKKVILALIIALAQHVFGQDSIYKKNGEIIASKIEEVNTSLIKFKKFNNLSGPLYSELKSEIFRIKFANGSIDTLNVTVEVKQEPIIQNKAIPDPGFVTKQSLMYRSYNDRDLLYIIQKLPTSDPKNKMLREYANMMQYKRTQYLANGLGFGIGFAVPVVVTYITLVNYNSYSYNSRYDPTAVIVVGALAGAAIRITGQVLTKMNKNKRLNAKKNIMILYDQLN